LKCNNYTNKIKNPPELIVGLIVGIDTLVTLGQILYNIIAISGR